MIIIDHKKVIKTLRGGEKNGYTSCTSFYPLLNFNLLKNGKGELKIIMKIKHRGAYFLIKIIHFAPLDIGEYYGEKRKICICNFYYERR